MTTLASPEAIEGQLLDQEHRHIRAGLSSLQETIGRIANKFFHGLGESDRPGVLRKSILISNVASHDAHFVRFGMNIERNCPLPHPTELLLRQPVGEECPH